MGYPAHTTAETGLASLYGRQVDGIEPWTIPGVKEGVLWEGGALSIATGLGYVDPLVDKGIVNASEAIGGGSGGLGLAAVAKTGQTDCMQRVLKDLVCQGFVNEFSRESIIECVKGEEGVLRLSAVKPILDGCLDLEALYSGPTEVVFGVTNLANYEFVPLSTATVPKHRFTEMAVANMGMPFVAGRPNLAPADVPIKEGTPIADCFLGCPSAVQLAQAHDFTNVVIFNNQPRQDAKHTLLNEVITCMWAGRYGGPRGLLGAVVATAVQPGRINKEPPSNIERIYPDANREQLPDTLERDYEKLVDGFMIGRRTCEAVLAEIEKRFRIEYRLGQNACLAELGYETVSHTPTPERASLLRRFFGRTAVSKAHFALS